MLQFQLDNRILAFSSLVYFCKSHKKLYLFLLLLVEPCYACQKLSIAHNFILS